MLPLSGGMIWSGVRETEEKAEEYALGSCDLGAIVTTTRELVSVEDLVKGCILDRVTLVLLYLGQSSSILRLTIVPVM